MAQPPLTFHKVLAMPPNPAADGLYFVRTASGVRLVVTESDGDAVDLEAVAPRFTEIFPEAAQWIVNHNLGAKPAGLKILTVGGVEVDAHVVHTSDNQFVVSINPPMAGQVVVQ